jgi:predicted nuclease with RNAse H fold
MHTLGIDLASQADRTAMASISWTDGRATVGAPVSPVSDDLALDALQNADWAGIDAPFGWPDAVVGALRDFADRGVWPKNATRESLRFRVTDLHVRERVKTWPLSVSSDRIAIPAWRCARLLAAYAPGRVDRLGASRVVEVYPGAALTVWGFRRRGYKRNGNAERRAEQRETRERLVDHIAARGVDWLDLTAARDACLESDDALDAVIAGLVARAAALDLTVQPPSERLQVIRREGWIHLPRDGSFEKLAADSSGAPYCRAC